MAAKLSRHTGERRATRLKKKKRIHKKFAPRWGTVPRMIPFRSNKFLTVQIVDDLKGVTICQGSTREKGFPKPGVTCDAAKELGKLIGQRAKEKKIERIVFDRSGYDYHGRIKALADAARESGLVF